MLELEYFPWAITTIVKDGEQDLISTRFRLSVPMSKLLAIMPKSSFDDVTPDFAFIVAVHIVKIDECRRRDIRFVVRILFA